MAWVITRIDTQQRTADRTKLINLSCETYHRPTPSCICNTDYGIRLLRHHHHHHNPVLFPGFPCDLTLTNYELGRVEDDADDTVWNVEKVLIVKETLNNAETTTVAA